MNRRNSPSAENRSDKLERLIDEIKGVRDAAEQLYTLFDHAWRNREELFELLTGTKIERKEEIPETLSCDNCDASADSIAEALQEGWIDLNYDPDGRSWNYIGHCPDCQKEDEEEFHRLNPQLRPTPVLETPPPKTAEQQMLFPSHPIT